MSKETIIVSGGFYSTNIGNAFYDFGAKYMLEKCVGDKFNAVLSSDHLQIAWAGGISDKGTLFDYIGHYKAKYVLFTGPMLTPSYLKMWEKNLELLMNRGSRVIFFSAGANAYNDEEYAFVSDFLKKHKLYALFTRDAETYDLYGEFFEHSYKGICCALYSCDYAPKYELDIKPYVIMNFDNRIEPAVVRADDGNIVIDGVHYALKDRTPLQNILGRGASDTIGDYEVLRTIHTVLTDKRLKRTPVKNAYLSDVPYDYLNLYANASAVITNRVHAAVASLSYGTPVYIANPTPRGNILARIGAQDAYKGLYVSDRELINREKALLEAAVKEIIV